MKISGFTIARNAIQYNYPIVESIRSILPICDEFIVNVGDSQDRTLDIIQSISPKVKVVQNTWDMDQGKEVLSEQTNIALSHCTGDWAFYLQSDEVIHEDDLGKLKSLMERHLNDDTDAFRFKWLHFYGSYFRYRVDHGWYQKQDRIIRNNGQIESFGDAFAFQRKDGKELKRVNTGCLLYHYGWVQPQDVMTKRWLNAVQIGFTRLQDHERTDDYSYGNLRRFAAYFGSHPKVMHAKVEEHSLSQDDLKKINQEFWWHPLRALRIRYKTGLRVKDKII